jgi:hypothetical protein
MFVVESIIEKDPLHSLMIMSSGERLGMRGPRWMTLGDKQETRVDFLLALDDKEKNLVILLKLRLDCQSNLC